jgi:RNA polymerase sigma factor (TIGR02999 family)
VTSPDTTQLVIASRSGDRVAFDLLYSHLYDELRQIAHRRLLRHRPGDTLNTTALVHEAYVKLVDHDRAGLGDRAHFLALASRAMRFVLVDQARARASQKRGAGAAILPLHLIEVAAENEPLADLLALDEALVRLESFSERQGRLVEYRFFGGLTYEEIAVVMDTSVRTVKREWERARTWLYTYMQAPPEAHNPP